MCGWVAIDHKAWRRSKAKEAGVPIEEWEGLHWIQEEEVDHVQETLDEIAVEETRSMQPKHPAASQYMVRAVTDPFEISIHNLLDGVQGRVLALREEWGPFASLHEIESVIREEVAEFSSEVFREKKKRKRAKAELFDIITAAARAWAELDQGEPLSDLKASKKRRKALAE